MTRPHPVQTSFWLACDALIWRHCAPWELDEALTAWGYLLPPFEAQDLVGLDRVLAARDGAGSPILGRMVAEGRLGKAAGWGHYRYPGGGGAVIDPLLEDLICEEARFGGVTRSDLSDAALIALLHDQIRDHVRGIGPAAAELLHLPADRIALI